MRPCHWNKHCSAESFQKHCTCVELLCSVKKKKKEDVHVPEHYGSLADLLIVFKQRRYAGEKQSQESMLPRFCVYANIH